MYKVTGTLFVHRELQLHMKNSKNLRHCVRVYRTVWLYSKCLCLRWACNYNNNHSHIYSCWQIDKQPVREYTVQILNFLKAFFWSGLHSHTSRNFVACICSLCEHPSHLRHSCSQLVASLYKLVFASNIVFPFLHPFCLFVCFTVR